MVLHGSGPLSAWAANASPGAPAAVSGPGRGYEVDADCRSFLLAGDESALPALGLLVAAMPLAGRRPGDRRDRRRVSAPPVP